VAFSVRAGAEKASGLSPTTGYHGSEVPLKSQDPCYVAADRDSQAGSLFRAERLDKKRRTDRPMELLPPPPPGVEVSIDPDNEHAPEDRYDPAVPGVTGERERLTRCSLD
jgi:hypothetical protein